MTKEKLKEKTKRICSTMGKGIVLTVLFALILLKIVLPQPALEQGRKMGILQFRYNDRPYFAKIIGDMYLGAFIIAWGVLTLTRPALGGSMGNATCATMFLGPMISPVAYLLMKPGTDRTIRFCGSAVLAAAWLLWNMPAF